MTQPMALTRDEKKELKATTTEKEWYVVCDRIQVKRSGQYPPYLSREILELYQQKFQQIIKEK